MEAVKAAWNWQFVSATRNGEPIPCMVLIELTFMLR